MSRKDAIATPRRFIGNNQSIIASARKINFVPDIIAGIEEDEYGEATKNLAGRVWKIYKVTIRDTKCNTLLIITLIDPEI